MKKSKLLCIVLAGVMLAGSLAACTSPAEPPPTAQPGPAPTPTPPPAPPPEQGPSGSVVIAIAIETPSVAPARHNSAAGFFKNIMTHNGLFRQNYVDLEPIPDLVASWSAISDTVFEFTLHEGIMFHNGEEMTSADVEASFHYVRQYPETRTAHQSAVGIEVIDRYTFRLDTGTPNAALFFDLVGQGNFVMPKSLIDSGHDFTVAPIGSGPFVFEEWRLGDSLQFRAFDNFFNPERAAKVEEVTWRIIPEGSSRTISLETGEIDLVVDVAYADVARLEAHPDITVFMRPGPTLNHIVLNHDRPQFSNVYARRAISMAVDQEALVMAAFGGLAVPLRAQIPTVFTGSSEEGVLPYDPEGARALLAEHGIDPASLAFDMIATTEERRVMAEVVQAQLLEIGIPTTITMMDHATSIQIMNDGQYDSGFGMWGGTFIISTFRGVFHGGIGNRSNINNPELDELIDKAIATSDANERAAIFMEASRVLNEYVGSIPTHMPMSIRAFNSNLIVPEISATGALNLGMVFWAE